MIIMLQLSNPELRKKEGSREMQTVQLLRTFHTISRLEGLFFLALLLH